MRRFTGVFLQINYSVESRSERVGVIKKRSVFTVGNRFLKTFSVFCKNRNAAELGFVKCKPLGLAHGSAGEYVARIIKTAYVSVFYSVANRHFFFQTEFFYFLY